MSKENSDPKSMEEKVTALAAERDEQYRGQTDLWETHLEPPWESPIETTFALAMKGVFEEFGGGQVMTFGPRDISDVKIEMHGDDCAPFHAYLWSQVSIGKYRVDFLIVYRRGGEQKNRYAVIECDGHEFHERTKEQAERDKRRDRELQAMGFPVLRLTGSEIWRSPVKCAFGILMTALRSMGVFRGQN